MPLFFMVFVLGLTSKTAYAEDCQQESSAKIESAKFFELKKLISNQFKFRTQLLHAKVLTYQENDTCRQAFKLKLLTEQGGFDELFYDVKTLEKIPRPANDTLFAQKQGESSQNDDNNNSDSQSSGTASPNTNNSDSNGPGRGRGGNGGRGDGRGRGGGRGR